MNGKDRIQSGRLSQWQRHAKSSQQGDKCNDPDNEADAISPYPSAHQRGDIGRGEITSCLCKQHSVDRVDERKCKGNGRKEADNRDTNCSPGMDRSLERLNVGGFLDKFDRLGRTLAETPKTLDDDHQIEWSESSVLSRMRFPVQTHSF
jgi:hypothetical protein